MHHCKQRRKGLIKKKRISYLDTMGFKTIAGGVVLLLKKYDSNTKVRLIPDSYNGVALGWVGRSDWIMECRNLLYFIH